jgi:hypothetical protein
VSHIWNLLARQRLRHSARRPSCGGQSARARHEKFRRKQEVEHKETRSVYNEINIRDARTPEEAMRAYAKTDRIEAGLGCCHKVKWAQDYTAFAKWRGRSLEQYAANRNVLKEAAIAYGKNPIDADDVASSVTTSATTRITVCISPLSVRPYRSIGDSVLPDRTRWGRLTLACLRWRSRANHT